ncbi:hypothetical protein OIT41_13850 [Arthrobacter sp. YA7-1]|uniref:hypothetical protein n=1 Tax=Arthrobacter sp. YA7-1 TaxID=2987701 RepID=UPI002226535E|nr:hypothetical protein [Arthrobacter sp. YA7-1]UYY80406.1 hypothetical protein OIT41_13850 [Arthrobacter sp. YA7-1]
MTEEAACQSNEVAGAEPAESNRQRRPAWRPWLRGGLTKLARGWRVAFPAAGPGDPEFDTAAELIEKYKHEREFVKGGVVILPLLMVLWVALNLLIQAGGDGPLAIVIASQIPVGSLALIAAINLLSVVLIGLVMVIPSVAGDDSYGIHVRAALRRFYVPLVAVMLLVYAVVFALGVLVATYVLWRLQKDRSKKAAQPIPFADWIAKNDKPRDAVLARLWEQARAARAQARDESAFASSPESQGFHEQVTARYQAIASASRKNIYNAIFAVFMGGLAVFGMQLVTTPMRFGHLESLHLSDGRTLIGYVLSQDGRNLLITDPAKGLYQYASSDQIVSRAFCSTPASVATFKIVDFSRRLDGVDCAPQ